MTVTRRHCGDSNAEILVDQRTKYQSADFLMGKKGATVAIRSVSKMQLTVSGEVNVDENRLKGILGSPGVRMGLT